MTSNIHESQAASLALRPENDADEPVLQALFSSVRAPQFVALGLPAPMVDMMMRQQFHAQTAGHGAQYPNARREIVEADGAAIGRLATDRNDQRLHLIDIVLAPDRRGQGLGTILIGQLMEEARATGLPMTLQVARDNPAAALYARLGFETVAADDAYQSMRWTPA